MNGLIVVALPAIQVKIGEISEAREFKRTLQWNEEVSQLVFVCPNLLILHLLPPTFPALASLRAGLGSRPGHKRALTCEFL